MAAATNLRSDGDLLRAWDRYVAAMVAFKAKPLGTDEEDDPYYRAIGRAEEAIAALPATTAAGLLVKVKLLCSLDRDSSEAQDAILFGKRLPDTYLSEDHGSRLKWGLLEDLERLAQEG